MVRFDRAGVVAAALVSAGAVIAGGTSPAEAQTPNLVKIGGASSGAFSSDGGGAEIPAFDPASKRLFVVDAIAGGVDVLDLTNPSAPASISTLSLAGFAPNSVAVRNGILAVAAQASSKTSTGRVLFYRASDGQFLSGHDVGSLPDMLTFSPDGTKLLVANEGEPDGYVPGNVDPEGSVSVLSLSYPSAGNVQVNANARIGFRDFNPQRTQLNDQGVRIYGPGATVAQDLEPEYITVSPDNTKAFVTLQENNALATIDLATNTVTGLKSFGFKDHSLAANALDASDRDNAAGNGGVRQIKTQPIRGLYLPDSIASFSSGGQTYLVTANEGDAREYAGFPDGGREDPRLSALTLDPTVFPNAATLLGNGPDGIGRLRVSAPRLNDVNNDGTPDRMGDTDGDGDLDAIYSLGGRSFSVWDQAGNLVFDSGDDIEQIVAAAFPNNFNADHSGAGGNALDSRSPAKGPEPEGVVIGQAFGKTLLFVGLERQGGILMYDLADPANPQFLQYVNPRDFTVAPTGVAAGDLGPEGLAFIPADQSPNGLPLLVVGNEVSGTVAVYAVPEPSSSALALLAVGATVLARRRRAAR